MSRLYGDRVLVTEQRSDVRCVIWRGRTYRVKDVLSRWHLYDRWWNDPMSVSFDSTDGDKGDRQYCRLESSSGLLCDVYFDAAVQGWFLD